MNGESAELPVRVNPALKVTLGTPQYNGMAVESGMPSSCTTFRVCACSGTLAFSKRLTPATWERHGTRSLVVTDELDGEPARKTRVVDDVCVFFNRAPGPDYGCSLHHLAEREGLSILETRPEVCWQVPVRREWEDLGDERSRTTLTEFSRAAWGEGGADLSWWCSASVSAHSGGADSTHDGLEAADVPGRSTPMVRTYEEELRALIGDSAYEELDRLCELRLSQGGTIEPLPLVEP